MWRPSGWTTEAWRERAFPADASGHGFLGTTNGVAKAVEGQHWEIKADDGGRFAGGRDDNGDAAGDQKGPAEDGGGEMIEKPAEGIEERLGPAIGCESFAEEAFCHALQGCLGG